MITKQPRGKQGYYDVKLVDRRGKSFIMTVGGNFDLYWIPEDYKENTIFELDNTDKIAFSVFSQLFDAIKKVDDKYLPVLDGNIITFISEDWPEEEANTLRIIKEDDLFTIKFIANTNEKAWTSFHRGSNICFCNSGSRVPRVESLFMRLFNFLAYECELIESEGNQDELENS
ncbi:MAG: hypothetical protein IJY90_01440 [Clostridia bacterium]|nr:hypothetical protein [Clostridia bacterium]